MNRAELMAKFGKGLEPDVQKILCEVARIEVIQNATLRPNIERDEEPVSGHDHGSPNGQRRRRENEATRRPRSSDNERQSRDRRKQDRGRKVRAPQDESEQPAEIPRSQRRSDGDGVKEAVTPR